MTSPANPLPHRCPHPAHSAQQPIRVGSEDLVVSWFLINLKSTRGRTVAGWVVLASEGVARLSRWLCIIWLRLIVSPGSCLARYVRAVTFSRNCCVCVGPERARSHKRSSWVRVEGCGCRGTPALLWVWLWLWVCPFAPKFIYTRWRQIINCLAGRADRRR